ncbi:hypothetical protein KGP36_07750 [Patescibacteria group bacterium]|nr:hypothetical protein [Patescibacteria group bacterium]
MSGIGTKGWRNAQNAPEPRIAVSKRMSAIIHLVWSGTRECAAALGVNHTTIIRYMTNGWPTRMVPLLLEILIAKRSEAMAAHLDYLRISESAERHLREALRIAPPAPEAVAIAAASRARLRANVARRRAKAWHEETVGEPTGKTP